MTEHWRRFQPQDLLEKQLILVAENLRKEARGTPAGIKRDQLLRRARQAETGARISEWAAVARPATDK